MTENQGILSVRAVFWKGDKSLSSLAWDIEINRVTQEIPFYLGNSNRLIFFSFQCETSEKKILNDCTTAVSTEWHKRSTREEHITLSRVFSSQAILFNYFHF